MANKEARIPTLLRMPPSVLEKLSIEAKSKGVSRNSLLLKIILKAISNRDVPDAVEYGKNYSPVFCRIPKSVYLKTKAVAYTDRIPMNSFIVREVEWHIKEEELKNQLNEALS